MTNLKRPTRATNKRRQKPQAESPSLEGTDWSEASLDPTNRLALLYFFSGIPALLYQTVWQRLLVLHSGVGYVSVSIIVAAYMLGLGLGSWLGGWLSRHKSARHLLWLFAAMELAIAVYAYASPTLLYDILYRQLGSWYDDMPTAAALHIATLVLPTTLMGMTLPLLTSAITQMQPLAPRGISIIYGSNALGAATGALLTPWILMPFVGVQGVCSIGATINFLVAVVAIQLGRTAPAATTQASHPDHQPSLDNANSPSANSDSWPVVSFGVWTAIYFLSGFLAIGLEILWFRILDVSVKSSAYTFGTLLAVYLGCLALGSLAGARNVQSLRDPFVSYLRIQCAVVVLALLPCILLIYAPESLLKETWLFQYWAGSDPLYPSFARWGAILMLYVCLPLLVMGPATFSMGYSFAALQRGVQLQAVDSGYRVGLLQAANILGCVLGSLLVGMWWLGSFGTPTTWRMLAGLGALFALLGVLMTQQRLQFGLGLAIIGVLTACVPGGDALWLRLHGELSDSQMVIAEDVSGLAAAAPEKQSSQWRVSANGKSQSSLPFGGFHAKLGALPATLHPHPTSIAIIGLGSGNTAWAAACRPQSQKITVFEVCTAEKPLLEKLVSSGAHPQLKNFLEDPRINIIGRDARHALMTDPDTYDLIETDAIRPHSAYAGYLYSLEFFQLCRSRLNAGGLMCCWSPTQGTYSTFRQAFPYMLTLDNGYLLIGSAEPIELDKSRWKSMVMASEIQAYLGPDVTRECQTSIDSATTIADQFSVPMINTDLFPFDEFH